MTKQEIEAVFDRVRTWPEDRQAYAALVLMGLEREDSETYEIAEGDREALEQALGEEERGEFATDEDIRKIFDRYR